MVVDVIFLLKHSLVLLSVHLENGKIKKNMKKYLNSLEKIDKIAFVILIILLAMILIGCRYEPYEPACKGIERPEMVCTMEVDKVCGCDGVTYINPCHAEKKGVFSYRLDSDEPCNPW
jgi:hypothetical protein